MTNAWTGGQYSVFRAFFGAYLFGHFALLLPLGAELFSSSGVLPNAAASPFYPLFPNPLFIADAPAVVSSIGVIGLAASVALTLGWRDRIASILIGYLVLCLFTRNPHIPNPGVLCVLLVLLLHALLPRMPFGAWDARGRIDPDSGWRMPSRIYLFAWVILAFTYTSSGVSQLAGSSSQGDGTSLALLLGNPLPSATLFDEARTTLPSIAKSIATSSIIGAQILFAPLAIVARLRPWLWLGMLGLNLGTVAFLGSADLGVGLILLHGFTFDPGWIGGRSPSGHTVVFYDGSCGLCHLTVRLLLAEDADGSCFRFTPLDSPTFRTACSQPGSGLEDQQPIPDSVIVQRPGEAMLTRSEGVIEVGHQLGGLWRIIAIIVGWIPLGLLNVGYDFVANTRQRIFARPSDACPLLPPHLRDRFD